MALVFQLDASAGDIILSGTVDGVDLAALEADVEAHDHTVSGNVADATETGLPITNSAGTPLTVYTAASEGGVNDQYETGYGGTNTRTHNHAASDGSGALTTAVTYATTGLSPKTANEIILDHAVGDITCDLIDGVAPEVLWDQYDDHYHTLTGETAYTTLPALNARGASGNTFFRVSNSSDGSSPYWGALSTQSGQHRHGANTLQTAVEDAGSGAGSDDAGDPKISVDHTTGNLALKGDVNGIGIAQFQAAYDAHTHSGGAGGQTATRTGADSKATLRVGGVTDVWVLTSGGSWVIPYIYPPDHYHAGSALGVGLTFSTPT